jgi:NADP-dependent 3-hydroxy acid dehydrogenase YdfG
VIASDAKVVVVTGASGAIGGAVARALGGPQIALCLTARDVGRLEACARELAPRVGRVLTHPADIASDEGIRGLAARVEAELGRVDVLVHAAGGMRLGNIENAGWSDLDEQYRINLRAPFLLTKALLPLLKRATGQVVFVNSTAALAPGPENGLYAATKSGLRTLVSSVRDHVNGYGIRVLSVFPGRTASRMQQAIHDFERKRYQPWSLLQPEDVAAAVAAALALPRTAEVTKIVVRPMKKPSQD